MRDIGIGIGIPAFKKRINMIFDQFDDGTTYMTLGLIDGVLSLWYTQTDEVINTWDNEG